NISIELGPTTMEICSEESLADKFLTNLSAASIIFFDGPDMMFDLPADSGTMRFRSVSEAPPPEISQPIYRWGEVADRLWVLVGYGDAANPTVVEEGTKITAAFSSVEPTVSGSGGCNEYNAGYTFTDEGGLTINGPIGATRMACEKGGEQEAAYFSALETVTNWTINEEGRLELTYDSGQPYEEKLIFAPGETPLTFTTWRLVSYGNPDELVDVVEGTAVTADLFDTDENDKIIEHWDVIQAYVEDTASGRTMVDGPTEIEDLDKTEENKALVTDFCNNILIGGQAEKITDYISTEQYDQHNPHVEDGLEGFGKHLQEVMTSGQAAKYVKIHRIIGQGNFVVAYSHVQIAGEDYAFFDLFRVKEGKIVEHWDVQEKILPQEQWGNSGKF
ncbi:MAG TPA: META domain-containing protein, partial [Chloroflexi bacterium]|nr:META domain-containing protein [Chloroflexota bacterium]